jgi:hypothetical protein
VPDLAASTKFGAFCEAWRRSWSWYGLFRWTGVPALSFGGGFCNSQVVPGIFVKVWDVLCGFLNINPCFSHKKKVQVKEIFQYCKALVVFRRSLSRNRFKHTFLDLAPATHELCSWRVDKGKWCKAIASV